MNPQNSPQPNPASQSQLYLTLLPPRSSPQSEKSTSSQPQALPSLEALENKGVRLELAKDFYFFCAIYLPHYFLLDGAKFHREMMQELTDVNNKRLEIIGFRGSAKSTIGSTALPIWMGLVHPGIHPF